MGHSHDDGGIAIMPKYAVYGLGLATLYWVLPPKDPLVFGAGALGAYLGLQWYDREFAEWHPEMPMPWKKPCCKGCGEKKGCQGSRMANDIFGPSGVLQA